MKSLQIPSVEISNHEQICCDQVIAIAKSRKRELNILYAFAVGLNRRQVADKLKISVKTVDTYKTNLLAFCRNAWNLPLNEKLTYRFLHADGLTPQQVADRLWISIKTVHSHKTKLLALCRSAWNLSRDEWLDYHFLNEKFAGFSSHAKRETLSAIR
jgi:DNA-binding CsgD family transcriptional regulator